MLKETFERKYARLENRVAALEKETTKLKEVVDDLLKTGIGYLDEGEEFVLPPMTEEEKAFEREAFGSKDSLTEMDGQESAKEDDALQPDSEMIPSEEEKPQLAGQRQPTL